MNVTRDLILKPWGQEVLGVLLLINLSLLLKPGDPVLVKPINHRTRPEGAWGLKSSCLLPIWANVRLMLRAFSSGLSSNISYRKAAEECLD
jgi:hypothetical protein